MENDAASTKRYGGVGHPIAEPEFDKQLLMVRTDRSLLDEPEAPDGYALRQFRAADRDAYSQLFGLAFEKKGVLGDIIATVHYGGFFVVEHYETGNIVASSIAHGPIPRFPDSGMLGWLVADPRHAGKGLGTLVSAAVTNRLSLEPCDRNYLLTDDHRLPAIGIYLKLGWRPCISGVDMERRWRDIHRKLNRDFDPSTAEPYLPDPR
jgi:mycothiol synthase